MIDLKRLLEDPEIVLRTLRKRDPTIDISDIIELASTKKQVQLIYEGLLQETNHESERLASVQKDSDDFVKTRAASKNRKERTREIKLELEKLSQNLESRLLEIPNIVLEDVPVSQNKEDKHIVHYCGKKPEFDFPVMDHVTLGDRLGILDFKRATKIAGPGFPLYRGKGAVLEWALINYMVRNAVEKGFEFLLPPLLNNTASLVATGNLPKFEEELYSCTRDDLHLIPTAETPITNLYRDEIVDFAALPIRLVAYSPCFRREAGAGGKMAKGLMRLHQFHKLETYSICLPDHAAEEHKLLVENGEQILRDLNLHFRLANLPSCDLAQQSAQTFDIEIWLPHLGQYSEVSSASNCLDYQARRANIKYKRGEKKSFVTTLNCSALATPRVMIALLEANQTPDGHVKIPEALVKYTGFDVI